MGRITAGSSTRQNYVRYAISFMRLFIYLFMNTYVKEQVKWSRLYIQGWMIVSRQVRYLLIRARGHVCTKNKLWKRCQSESVLMYLIEIGWLSQHVVMLPIDNTSSLMRRCIHVCYKVERTYYRTDITLYTVRKARVTMLQCDSPILLVVSFRNPMGELQL